MKGATTISVIAMIAIAAGSFYYMDRLGLNIGAGRHVSKAEVEVPDTSGLMVGSRVLLRGVEIGHITDVSTGIDKAKIGWNYDRSYKIPEDSLFRIDNLSALGEPFLSIAPQTAEGPYLPDGGAIPSSQVTVPTTFKELSEKLTKLLEQVAPGEVQGIFNTLDVALPDDHQVLGDLNRAGRLLASTITEQSSGLRVLLQTLQPILLDSRTIPGDLRDTSPNAEQLATSFNDMISTVKFAMQHLVPLKAGIAEGASPFLTEVQSFLDKSAGDLQNLGVDLMPSVQAGAAALRTVDIEGLLDNALAAAGTGEAITVHVRPPAGK